MYVTEGKNTGKKKKIIIGTYRNNLKLKQAKIPLLEMADEANVCKNRMCVSVLVFL